MLISNEIILSIVILKEYLDNLHYVIDDSDHIITPYEE